MTEAEQDRAHELLYSCDSREELCGRIAELEGLVRDMWDFYCVMPDEPHVCKEELDFSAEVWKRMRALGLEKSE